MVQGWRPGVAGGSLVRMQVLVCLWFGPLSLPCGPQEPRDRNPRSAPMPAAGTLRPAPPLPRAAPNPRTLLPSSAVSKAVPRPSQSADDWFLYLVHLRPPLGANAGFSWLPGNVRATLAVSAPL